MHPGKPGRTWRAAGSLLAALFCAACGQQHASPPRELVSLTVDGTSFEAMDTQSRKWRSDDLVGSVLNVRLGNSTEKVRIDAVSADTSGTSGVVLHEFSVARPDGQWRPLCKPAPDGSRAGFPLRGRWAANGQLNDTDPREFEIVCAAGAQGKCVRLGYQPWIQLPGGTSGMALFNACVRLLRADYAGNGQSMTRDGTPIAISDRFGIQDRGWEAGLSFEAGWNAAGAVCVHHPRVEDRASLKRIEASSRRLAGLTGEICTREKAEALGALIFNGSRA